MSNEPKKMLGIYATGAALKEYQKKLKTALKEYARIKADKWNSQPMDERIRLGQAKQAEVVKEIEALRELHNDTSLFDVVTLLMSVVCMVATMDENNPEQVKITKMAALQANDCLVELAGDTDKEKDTKTNTDKEKDNKQSEKELDALLDTLEKLVTAQGGKVVVGSGNTLKEILESFKKAS